MAYEMRVSDWSSDVCSSDLVLMVSSALFGILFGNLLFGTLGERIGRPRAIAICVFLFSAFTAGAGLTNDPKTFALARFVAGLGIGGVMPKVIAQMTEYSPKRMRAMLVALMFSGYCVEIGRAPV